MCPFHLFPASGPSPDMKCISSHDQINVDRLHGNAVIFILLLLPSHIGVGGAKMNVIWHEDDDR